MVIPKQNIDGSHIQTHSPENNPYLKTLPLFTLKHHRYNYNFKYYVKHKRVTIFLDKKRLQIMVIPKTKH